MAAPNKNMGAKDIFLLTWNLFHQVKFADKQEENESSLFLLGNLHL